MADFDHSFQKLVAEAVAACGSDRASIEAYVFKHMETAPEADRKRYRRDLDLVLGFLPPGFKEDDKDN